MKNSGLHRASGNADDRGDFVNGMALHGGEQKNEPQFFRQLTKSTIEVRLEFVRNGEVFDGGRRRLMRRMRPKGVALLSPLRRTQTIQGEPERDSNEPGAKTVAVAQPIEAAVGAQKRFLGDVFGVGGIAQNAAGDAVGERATFGEALLEFAPRFGLGRLAQKLVPGHATWLDQSQLLHTIPWSGADIWRPVFPYIQADAAAWGLVQRETPIPDIAD